MKMVTHKHVLLNMGYGLVGHDTASHQHDQDITHKQSWGWEIL